LLKNVAKLGSKSHTLEAFSGKIEILAVHNLICR